MRTEMSEKNTDFMEIVNLETQDINGGAVITAGAVLAISLFALGGVLGYGWAKSE